MVNNTLYCINILTMLFKVDALNISFYPSNIINQFKLTTKIPSLQTKVQLNVSGCHNYIFCTTTFSSVPDDRDGKRQVYGSQNVGIT